MQIGVTLSVALIEYENGPGTSPTTSMLVWLTGMPSSEGGVRSGPTVTLKLPLIVLPSPSSAEHVTGIVPSGNEEPDMGLQVVGTGFKLASMEQYDLLIEQHFTANPAVKRVDSLVVMKTVKAPRETLAPSSGRP